MPVDAVPRLSKCEFETRNPDEARAFVQTLGIHLDVAARGARRFDMCLNTFVLPNATIGYTQYGAAVSIRSIEADSDYWATLPVRGHFAAVSGSVATDCGPGRAFIMSPTRRTLVRLQEGSSRLPLRLSGAALTRQLAALLGEPINAQSNWRQS